MTDPRFEETLTRVLSEKAGWRAPADLRMRVASVPNEITPPGRLRRLWPACLALPGSRWSPLS